MSKIQDQRGKDLRGLNIPGIFPVILTKKTTFEFSYLCSCTARPFFKGSPITGKNFLPAGANSFRLQKTIFRRETKQMRQSCLS